VSSWHNVTQADVDAFAELTGDRQWIHIDPARARETPFGGTIAAAREVRRHRTRR
jgi:acyl dehydratase